MPKELCVVVAELKLALKPINRVVTGLVCNECREFTPSESNCVPSEKTKQKPSKRPLSVDSKIFSSVISC